MPALTSIALGATTALGGISGALGSEETSTGSVRLGRESAAERAAREGQLGRFQSAQAALGAGGARAEEAQTRLSDLLAEFSRTGGLPGQQDITRGRQFAEALAAPQQLALQQQFEQQRQLSSRQAALQGRAGFDPVLQNQLARSQFQQSSLLQSQIGAQAQQFALQQPQRRLGFAQAAAQFGLQNRLSSLGLGEQLLQSERNFRLATAERSTTKESGGGFGGFLTGALGGLGTGLSTATGLKGLFGEENDNFVGPRLPGR